MPQAKITEGYNRLRNPTEGKEVKLCYVTVGISRYLLSPFKSAEKVGAAQPERAIKSDEFRSAVKAMFVADKLGTSFLDPWD